MKQTIKKLCKSIKRYNAKLVMIESIVSLHRTEFTSKQNDNVNTRKYLNCRLHVYPEIGLLTTIGSTLLVLVALMMVMFSANPIKAQLATTVPKALAQTPAFPSASSPEVVVSLFGVNKPFGTIVAFVTAKNGAQNVTKAVVDDVMTLDKKDGRVDGVAQMFFRFGNATITVGSDIKACAIVIKDLSIVCSTAHKAPDPRTDIQLDLGSAANLKKIT